MKNKLIDITYVEHHAGSFEDGIQICIHCGHIITDYSGGNWASTDGNPPRGFQEGPIYITGKNPIETTTIKPLENYGGDDPYKRTIVKCV